MEAARTRTEQTKAVARKAHADAALACQKSAEFEHIELHVGMFQLWSICRSCTLNSMSKVFAM